jgi:hypothetical protein
MKVSWTDSPVLQPIAGGKWVLLEHFVAQVNSFTVFVPAGFVTDLDSVPRLPITYWLFKNRARSSALLHDYLYSTRQGKDYADRVFLYAMEFEGVHSWLRLFLYQGVRLFGRYPEIPQ